MGTAGWTIPRLSAHRCAGTGSHLERYSRVLSCVEINTSFHRSHSVATYARWAAATPPEFRFTSKMPRAITHELKLRRSQALVARFLQETAGLGRKRGPILVQLPPSLAFEARVALRFFGGLREQFSGLVVCEPRHPTWFEAGADQLLRRHRVSRVAADPPRAAGADQPGGWDGLAYFRLHGSPRMYWSRYSAAHLETLGLAVRAAAARGDSWIVFDNTAAGAAFENAWEFRDATAGTPSASSQS